MAGAITLSPLALPLPDLPPVPGVRLSVGQAGIRYQGRADVLLAEFAEATTVAGVFTRNLCPGAPVAWCREMLPGGLARGLVVNAGNANVFSARWKPPPPPPREPWACRRRPSSSPRPA
jgi:glutamate N-acetyltransferase/amino-acid N-acetyltransferase